MFFFSVQKHVPQCQVNQKPFVFSFDDWPQDVEGLPTEAVPESLAS